MSSSPVPAAIPVPWLPAGYRVRPATTSDADLAQALVVAHHEASGGNEPPPRSEVVADLEYPEIDLERDTWVVSDSEGRAVVYGIAYLDRPGRSFVDVFVDPTLPRADAVTLAVAVGERAIDRAREDASARGLDATLVEGGMLRDDALLPEVFGVLGFARARTWWRMSADADAIAAARPQPPEGIRIARIDPEDDAMLRVAHEVEVPAFGEHYGYVPIDFPLFRTESRESAGYDPNAWWIAYDTATDAPVGLLVGNDSRADAGAGFVDSLGVLATHRGRGVASALLRTSFAEYARRGRTSVALSVDSRNDTGAVALYERVGMRPIDIIDTWERPLPLTPHSG